MSQREFWNNKFNRDDYFYGENPNQFIASNVNIIKSNSQILCLGEGEGRNAIFLAINGFEVEAIDASDIGLFKLEKKAKKNNLKINTKCMDLNEWEINKKYDAIVASYLHMYKSERENLFNKIESSLNSGGYFIGEFFSTKQIEYSSGGPKDLELLYECEDFLNFFPNCKKNVREEIVFLDEGKGHQGEACVIRVVIEKL